MPDGEGEAEHLRDALDRERPIDVADAVDRPVRRRRRDREALASITGGARDVAGRPLEQDPEVHLERDRAHAGAGSAP